MIPGMFDTVNEAVRLMLRLEDAMIRTFCQRNGIEVDPTIRGAEILARLAGKIRIIRVTGVDPLAKSWCVCTDSDPNEVTFPFVSMRMTGDQIAVNVTDTPGNETYWKEITGHE